MIDYTDLIGVPFVVGGRDCKKGIDCYGLAKEIFSRFGQSIPEYTEDFHNIEKVSSLIKGEAEEDNCWQEAKREKMPIPCLLAIRFGVPKGVINHVGVYIGDGKFIHIRENTGVCVDRIDSPAWKRQIEGCYKFVGDNYGKASHC